MKWASVFPGQGSQQPGMGQFLFDNFDIARKIFEEASDAISVNMKNLCFTGPKEELELTENTQPALVTVSTALFRVLEDEFGFAPDVGAGHSVGEYSAMVASGAMSFADAVKAVRSRGQYMQEAVPVGKGGMLACIGATPEQIKKICAWTMEKSGFSPLEAANFNSPDQTVLSGSTQAIQWLQSHFDPSILDGAPTRIRMIPLKVSAPFHCSMMKPAEEKMSLFLGSISFSDAKWPIVQNFTAEATSKGPQLRENLVRQVTGSVRWVESILACREMGVSHAIECGSGKVLSGLLKKIDSEKLSSFNINSLDELKSFGSTYRK